MFEKEISSFAFNIAKKYTGERIPLRALLIDPELPDNFKTFAGAEVDEIIDDEEFGKSKSGKLDLSSPELQTLFKEIRHAVKNSFEFSREDFLDLTDKASKFLFNYVIRPRWTLEKFLFKGEKEISKANFFRAERFLGDYPYYSEGISEYMEYQKRDSIDFESWKKLHAKIDEHLLATLQLNAQSITGPLGELFEFAAGYFKIPADALILFFRDKSAVGVVDRLEFAKEVRGIQSLDYHDFESILEASAKEITQTVELPRSKLETSKDYQSHERREHNEKVAGEALETKAEVHDVIPAETPNETADRQLPIDLPSSAGDAGKKAPSVRTLLKAKDEARIIKRIFQGSRSLYHIAIHKLDESPDWKNASRIVEGIFIENGVDPFSKYAVAFTEAISKKFGDHSPDQFEG